jgi:hypothetical protein
MWSASAAVIMFFVRNRRLENVWRGQVAPIIAFVLLSVILAATVVGLGDLLQVAKGSPFHWLFTTAYACFALFGIGWALIMRAARPEVYAAIGRGADGRVLAELPHLNGSHAEPISVRVPFASAVSYTSERPR